MIMAAEHGKNILNTTLGFIGAGGIASALARGFCTSENFSGKIFMHNRSSEKILAMKRLFPDRIFVAESNQELIDKSEVIFPAVLPDVLRKIASELKFSPENRVVHIAAGIKLSDTISWFAPAQSVVRAVPLPFAERRIGPIVLFGSDPEISKLLSLIGSVVEVSTEKTLEVLAAITGMMVSYYALAGETIKWGMSKGVFFDDALQYTTSMNEALSVMMRNECDADIEAFLVKNTTPNGMNELGLKIIRESDAYASWKNALEEIGKRYGL
jgi:pyrroline-5-carboxylate reductase